MKKILFTSILCFGTALGAMAEVTDYIALAPANATAGSTLTVNVDLTNPTIAACAYQCDVVLPAGTSVVEGTLLAADRCPGHLMASRLREDGTYRILCYSLTNALIAGQSGTVATFDVAIADDLADGSYTFTVQNTVIADATGLSKDDATGQNSNLVIGEGGATGDMNGDGKVDTIDLGILINYILSSNYNGDINNDGKVDTIDLGEMINAILNH